MSNLKIVKGTKRKIFIFQKSLDKKEKYDATFMILGFACVLGFILTSIINVNLSNLLLTYQWGVLIIYISMDLFTQLLLSTSVMERIALWLAQVSKAKNKAILILFGILLFIVSGFLNNLTAILVILPILFILLNAVKLTSRYTASLFALLLAISNIGGASTPIGDFPAIIIMKSGLTSFSEYLIKAFPLFLFTSICIILIHIVLYGKKRNESDMEIANREINITLLSYQYRFHKVKRSRLIRIISCFIMMFLFWSFLPADQYPPEMIAIMGLSVAVLAAKMDFNYHQKFNLKPVFLIASFLFLAGLAKEWGIPKYISILIISNIKDPRFLLLIFMITTAVLTGLFGAGPTAAAMIPIVNNLANGPFEANSEWLAIAFAASICAGSSLFIWSATAGFLLSQKVDESKLMNENGSKLKFGIKEYFLYGLVHFIIQLIIAIIWLFFAID